MLSVLGPPVPHTVLFLLPLVGTDKGGYVAKNLLIGLKKLLGDQHVLAPIGTFERVHITQHTQTPTLKHRYVSEQQSHSTRDTRR